MRPLFRALVTMVALASPFAADLAAQQRLGPPMSPAALRARLDAYTADSMRGRLTGSEEHRQATRYIADQLQKAGLEPAGEDGTFFQKVPLTRRVLDSAATSVAFGRTLEPYTEYLPRDQGPNARSFDGVETIYAGIWGRPGLIGGEAVRGKAVILFTEADNSTVIKLQAQAQFAQAVAIIIANFDLMTPQLRAALASAPMGLVDGERTGPDLPSYLHISRALGLEVLGVSDIAEATPGRAGPPISGRIQFKDQDVETYNVVAVLRGTDPELQHEYVAIGAHSDHVGVGPAIDRDSLRAFQLELRRKQLAGGGMVTPDIWASVRVNMDSIRNLHPTPRLDSIYNGADDDGSGSMAVLEVARAFGTQRGRPKRSVLFVWHSGEELGLFGASHFTDHPTVPRDQIIAQLNLDMVGRGKPRDEVEGGPNYLQLIGSRRLSTQLGDLVERVSTSKRFNWAFDYQYDAAGHPEQFYCRSDHYMYARYGIPVVFMSTGGHADYHKVTDEVEYIDFEKLAKVARFTHELATALANGADRPRLDKPKPDPKGNCVQ